MTDLSTFDDGGEFITETVNTNVETVVVEEYSTPTNEEIANAIVEDMAAYPEDYSNEDVATIVLG